MIKASKVSGVEELLKHEKFRPAYETDNPTPTQTKPDRARIITKDTANGLHERSCIDIVIEKKIEGDFSPAVYIRPLNESIADLLAKRCVKEIKSFEKELVYTEVNERFLKMVPDYKSKFIFKECIFWYGYENSLHSKLIETARRIS